MDSGKQRSCHFFQSFISLVSILTDSTRKPLDCGKKPDYLDWKIPKPSCHSANNSPTFYWNTLLTKSCWLSQKTKRKQQKQQKHDNSWSWARSMFTSISQVIYLVKYLWTQIFGLTYICRLTSEVNLHMCTRITIPAKEC